MASVMLRIKSIKQPTGGYIKPSDFEVISFDDGYALNEEENIHGSIVGMAVDYLTRCVLGGDKKEIFKISIMGAMYAEKFGKKKNALKAATSFLKGIKKLDDSSIINACKLVTFDVWYRNPFDAMKSKGYEDTNPDTATIENIRKLIRRSIAFFEKYGPIVEEGFTFGPAKANPNAKEKMLKTGKGRYGGYTATVDSGDGDFLTKDTIWDFKVTKTKLTSKQTLQLLMYWIMGQHSGREVFKGITRLGIYNPRYNKVYLLDMEKVPREVIKTVENEVICY